MYKKRPEIAESTNDIVRSRTKWQKPLFVDWFPPICDLSLAQSIGRKRLGDFDGALAPSWEKSASMQFPLPIQNSLLESLPQECLDRIRPVLEQVTMPVRQVIERPNVPFSHVFFPQASILSVVAGAEEARIEVGIIGRDGMTGSCVVLGADTTPHECFVQIADGALRMSVADLRAALEADPVLRSHLLLYIRTFMLQTAQTAVANGRGTIEERLARWLLMCQDRLDTPEILLTHEFLSIMLGVRRPGVTIALNGLEQARSIRTARGRITIIDRARLEEIAGSIYTGHRKNSG